MQFLVRSAKIWDLADPTNVPGGFKGQLMNTIHELIRKYLKRAERLHATPRASASNIHYYDNAATCIERTFGRIDGHHPAV